MSIYFIDSGGLQEMLQVAERRKDTNGSLKDRVYFRAAVWQGIT